ncbi:MAG TPA: aminotransferase class V-fold PLP-dependent enzyme, partial [Gammaproteobacteria bacterium]|nr:aminotransferase class V-fold PLP-dependent enzyme [Gammaproteobacteria bacterium]
MTGINLQDEFPLPEGLVYLNHAGVAPWPRRTATAIERFAEENTTCGPVHYEAWLEVEASLRVQLRALLNAPSSDDIALVKNTSEALSFVAHGLDWRAGDNVVIPDQEFPSNRVVWESLAPQGVEVRQVNLSRGDSPEAALTAAVDRRTRLVSVSSVQYGTGLRLDLATLGAFFHDHRILFCVDAIQSLGALLMDVQHIQADFVMADGHKWLLAPEGLGVFYCRAECRDQLKLTQFGWHMLEQHTDFDRRDWAPAKGARRFECGSPNMLGVHGLHASLSLLTEVGLDNIQRNVLSNSKYLID